MAAVLHAASREWLAESPFDNLSLNSLTPFDLKMLITETIKAFTQGLQRESKPAFVIAVADVTRTNPTLSTLNLLRSVISEAEKITWIVFAPEMILNVVDPSGVSPFYNIFPVRNLKTKFTTISSPYICGRPIRRREWLFGRHQVIADIQHSITRRSQPVALWGPRRIGKTSVLYALLDPLRASCFPVYLDLEGFATISGDATEFYWRLARQILYYEKDEFGESEDLPHQDQNLSFDELMSIVSRVEQRIQRNVVCLFDEIEMLERRPKDGFVALRQLVDVGLVRLIVGALRVKEWLSDSTLPIFGSFTGRKLGCLEKSAAIELIEHPVKNLVSYEPEAIEEILRLVGTHPQLVQMLCHSVISSLNHEGSNEATDKTIRRAYTEFIEMGWGMSHDLSSVLNPLCLDLLRAFEQMKQTSIGRDELLQYAAENVGDLAGSIDLHRQVTRAIEMLCDQEIIGIGESGDQYQLKAQYYIDTLVHS